MCKQPLLEITELILISSISGMYVKYSFDGDDGLVFEPGDSPWNMFAADPVIIRDFGLSALSHLLCCKNPPLCCC